MEKNDKVVDMSELMLREIYSILEHRDAGITEYVKKVINSIGVELQKQGIDNITINSALKILKELEQEVVGDSQKKGRNLYETIYGIMRRYTSAEIESADEEAEMQKKVTNRIQDERMQNEISIVNVEDSIRHYVSNTESFLARVGIPDRILEQIQIRDREIEHIAKNKIQETIIQSETDLGKIIREALQEIYGEVFNQIEKKEEKSDEALDTTGIFDEYPEEDKKTWELTPEEMEQFREGEAETLSNHENAERREEANEQSNQLEWRDIF